LDTDSAGRLRDAARSGALTEAVRLARLEPGDLHEDEAAERLARAVGGPGVAAQPPRQSRLDLTARWDGVVHVRVGELTRLNTLDTLEVVSLLHGQAAGGGAAGASAKGGRHGVG